MSVKRYTVCPDFLRPMSDQLEAGQYVLASDYAALEARLERANELLLRCAYVLAHPHIPSTGKVESDIDFYFAQSAKASD